MNLRGVLYKNMYSIQEKIRHGHVSLKSEFKLVLR